MNCTLKFHFVTSFFISIIVSNKTSVFCSTQSSLQILPDLGNWGPVEQCPYGTYVRGFQLKIESVQNFEDDNTAINAIRFLCEKIGLYNSEPNEIPTGENANKTGENMIQSSSGPWGTWRKMHYCSENQFAIGFQINSQTYFSNIKNDKSGATNFRLICSSSGNTFDVVEGEGMDWGTWADTHHQFCDKHHIICTIQTKVHVSIVDPSLKNCWHRETNGSVDQQSLTNLRTSCCQVPNPGETCIPVESWELIGECDHSELHFYETCNYVYTIGVSHDISSPDFDSTNLKAYENLGIDAKTISASLANNFNQKFKFKDEKFGKVTDFSWENTTDEDIWEKEKEKQVSFDLPPGYKVKVYQIVGKCGFYVVKTGRFRRIYSTINEDGHPVVLDEYFDNSTTFNIETEILKKLNESISFDLEDEVEIFLTPELLTYLILGLIAGPICIGFITYFILKFCIKKYTDEELVSESLSRTSTSGNRDSSLAIKNMGSNLSVIEMERF